MFAEDLERFMIYEQRHHPLAESSIFVKRVVVSTLVAGCLIGVTLLIGIFGYHIDDRDLE
jgi:hypothetical protein